MPVVIGINAKLWYRTVTGATYGTWSEIKNVRNVTVNLSANEADVTTRANAGWRATVPTLKDAAIEFEMIYDTDDAGFTAVRSAYFAGATLNIRALDGGTSEATGNGLDAHVRIINFTINQANEDAVTVSVSMKPTYATPAQAPMWVTAA